MEAPSVYGNAPDVIILLEDLSVLHAPSAGTVQFAEPVLRSEPNPAVVVPTLPMPGTLSTFVQARDPSSAVLVPFVPNPVVLADAEVNLGLLSPVLVPSD